jgi:hypothetical protein
MKARLLRGLRRYLVAGLLVWVPVGATLLTFKFLLDLVDKLLPLLPARWQPDALLGFHIPGFGALLAFVVLFLTGFLVANLIGSTLVGWWEDLLNRIPLVRSIYSSFKGLTETLVSAKAAVQQSGSGGVSAQGNVEHRLRDGVGPARHGRADRRTPGLCICTDHSQPHVRADRICAGQPGDRIGHFHRRGHEDGGDDGHRDAADEAPAPDGAAAARQPVGRGARRLYTAHPLFFA